MTRLVAKALRKGDTLALVAPAGPLDRPRIERAIAAYEEHGFHFKTYRDIYQRHGYLAGEDDVRVAELNEAFADPEVTAVVPARGGTGVTRILDRIDYDLIKNNPKIVTGFSDITALHLAVFSRTGLITFHSPNPMDGLGHVDGFTDLTARSYWRTLSANGYLEAGSAPWSVPLNEDEREQLVAFRPGVARGRLVGGNLALVCSLLGTPYEIRTAGSILFLEDIGEQPYRVDRFLSQLSLSGKIADLAGIVLGQFTDCLPEVDSSSLTLEQIFAHYFSDLGVPVLENFPTGHARDNATLPLGVMVELDADEKNLTILEDPVAV